MKVSPLLRTILWPLSLLYGVIVRVRVWLLRAWLAEEKAAERNSHQRWQSYCRRHRQDAHGDLDR